MAPISMTGKNIRRENCLRKNTALEIITSGRRPEVFMAGNMVPDRP